MDSGIYVLRFPNKYFYIGKSEHIQKRWEQHWKDFEKGTHSRRMQQAYNQYGYPTREVFISCHPDHCDLYESIAIEYNMSEYCLNGNQPRRVPRDEWDLLINNGQYIEMSTAKQIQLLEERLAALELADEVELELRARLDLLKRNGVMLPEEAEALVVEIRHELTDLERTSRKYLYELQRLKGMSWFDRLFNYKVNF